MDRMPPAEVSPTTVGPGLMVATVGRSGTSSATRLALGLGLRGPSSADLVTGTTDSLTGYWESRALATVSDQLLDLYGETWWTPPDSSVAVDRPRLKAFRRYATETFISSFGLDAGWVWKDPRLSQLLTFWSDALGEHPVLVTIRNPADVAASIVQRDTLEPAAALAIWERHTRRLLQQLPGRRVLVASYDDLQADPTTWQQRLWEFCETSGLPVGDPRTGVENRVRSAKSGASAQLTREQRHLADLLDSVRGDHPIFPTLDLGAESAACADLIRGIDVARLRRGPTQPQPSTKTSSTQQSSSKETAPMSTEIGTTAPARTREQKLAEAHERFDPLLAGRGLMAAEHWVRYDFAAGFVAGKRVLDISCGSGYGTRILADAGAESVLGADLSEEAVAAAARRFGTPRTEFTVADILSLSDELGSFDVIVCLETLEHLEDPARALVQLERRLAPGGLLVCSTPNAVEEWEDNPHHIFDFDEETLTDMAESVFSNVVIYPQRRAATSVIDAGPDAGEAMPPDVSALAGEPPSHFIALASHGPVSAAASSIRVGNDEDLRHWVERGLASDAIDADRQVHLEASKKLSIELTKAHAETELNRVRALEAATRLTNVESAVANQHEQIVALKKKNAVQRAQVRRLQKQLTTIRSSFSWRVTKWLRSFRRVQMKMRGK